MNTTISKVLEFIEENDVKFVCLGFYNLFGVHQNISIMADKLQDAFENGCSFDAHAICGFRDVIPSDLWLFPNPSTLMMMPWRPKLGRFVRFFCDIKTLGEEMFIYDGRYILKSVVERAKKWAFRARLARNVSFIC